MSSGMPTALEPYSVTRNFARALHVIATTCLAAALVVMLGFQTSFPQAAIWPAVIGLAPISVALFFADRHRRFLSSACYLLVGGASLYLFASTVGSALDPGVLSRSLTVELPAIALVLVGGIGSGAWSTMRWSATGFVVAESASYAGLAHAGIPFRFDWITTGAFALILLVLVFALSNRRRAALTRPRFTAAARDELLAALRYRLELRAAALLHDTLLSHLAAISSTTSNALDPALAGRMRRDLAALADGDWLHSPTIVPEHTDWSSSAVHMAIRDARARGLEVEVTGDLAAIERLDQEHSAQLGLAVAQCLVNVLDHAGTQSAEVAVHGSEREVLVMVVDTGDGFDVHEGRADRLGLRQSVRGRLEAIDGSAQVWSTPGKGTSVVLRVPVGTAAGRPVTSSMRERAR